MDESFAPNPRAKAIMALRSAPEQVARPYVMPPGTPADIVKTMRDAFKKTSVGYGWNERFDEALHDVEVVELSRTVPEEDGRPKAYAACNAAIRHEATAKATSLDDKPILIAVYNGNPGDGRGGTADAVREWNSQYDPLEIVEISTPGN